MMMSDATPFMTTSRNAPAFLQEPSSFDALSSYPAVAPSSSMTCMPLPKPSSKASMSMRLPAPLAAPGRGLAALPKKPLRPLTGYHIFFQIEREYIIQTLEGAVADPSILEGKARLPDVPDRYADILLAPDWYAGPGKRKKRKHRKQHGKIGFLELSRVVSERWATLERDAPDVKAFVQGIAKRELDAYYEEMKAYKEATKDLLPEAKKVAGAPKKKARKRGQRPAAIPSMSSMPLLRNDIDHFLRCLDDNDAHQPLLPRLPPHQTPQAMPRTQVVRQVSFKSTEYRRQDSGHLSLSAFDPIMDMSAFVEERPAKKQRLMSLTCGSPHGVDMCPSPSSFEVDICDEEIMDLWKS